mmetsp:Transcript_16046/g.28902  ORF Transcript_16046/g.28902 Transcript_16046/m.28902 type:complete len:87 (+) Transcript_16046:79-339(+)
MKGEQCEHASSQLEKMQKAEMISILFCFSSAISECEEDGQYKDALSLPETISKCIPSTVLIDAAAIWDLKGESDMEVGPSGLFKSQ